MVLTDAYIKEEAQQILSDRITKLTINVNEGEYNNQRAPVADSETCRTPTADEHRIPEVLTCPPAPRKRKVSFSADKNEAKKIFDDKEIETIFFPDQDSSKTSSKQ